MDESYHEVLVTHGVDHPEDDCPGVLLVAPYNPEFRNELKTLPTEARRWWPEENGWWVSEEYAEYAEDLMIHHYNEVRVEYEDGTVEYRSAGGPTARQERFL